MMLSSPCLPDGLFDLILNQRLADYFCNAHTDHYGEIEVADDAAEWQKDSAADVSNLAVGIIAHVKADQEYQF